MKAEHGGRLEAWAREWGCSPREITDFSASLNPLGPPSPVGDALADLGLAQRYPDESILVDSLSGFLGVGSGHLLLGNGSAEILYFLMRALAPKRVLLPVPTFTEYERAAAAAGSEVQHFFGKGKLLVDPIVMEEAARPGDLLVICNPNNPTGALWEDVHSWVNRLNRKGALVLIDEAFMLFVQQWRQQTLTSLAAEGEGVFVAGSLTKIFAAPGLRAGFLVSSRRAISRLESERPPWSVGTHTVHAMAGALKEKGYLEKTFLLLDQERKFLRDAFEEIGIAALDSAANFLLLKLPDGWSGEEVQRCLRPYRILVRTSAGFKGIDSSFIRVAVRNRSENATLVEALKAVLAEDPSGACSETGKVRGAR